MNKISLIIATKKVEIWKSLKGIKSISKVIANLMSWLSILMGCTFWCGASFSVETLFNWLSEDLRYLELMGNMVLIPLYFSIAFWIITAFSKLSMCLIANKMNNDEMVKAGIVRKKKYIFFKWKIKGDSI